MTNITDNIEAIDVAQRMIEGAQHAEGRLCPQYLSQDQIRHLLSKIERLRAENARLRLEHDALIDEVMGDVTGGVS